MSKIENTNFIVSQSSAAYDYNRLRFRGDYEEDEFFFTMIGDIVNYYAQSHISPQKSDTVFQTQTQFQNYEDGTVYAKLYRLYGGYEDDADRVLFGVQNISMGVGRIWNPTNLFNPRNIYALEPDETFGFFGLSYSRHLSDMTDATFIISQKADKSYKYAGQYKTFAQFADMGLTLVYTDKIEMLGYGIEANLGQTGIEVRSEGAYIKTKLKTKNAQEENREFFQAVVGADYAFSSGLNLLVEALLSNQTFSYEEMVLNNSSEIMPNLSDSNVYAAVSFMYDFNMFLGASLLYIESFSQNKSRFLSPVATYTFDDYNTFIAGAILQQRDGKKELQVFGDSYYLRWNISF